MFLSKCGIALTLAACSIVSWEQYQNFSQQFDKGLWGDIAEHSLFILIVILLIYGSLVYQITRLGYLHRLQNHQPASRASLDELFSERVAIKPLTILVPSYKEERRIIEQTVMSAALQEYPDRRVVLLIDNPPNPVCDEDIAQLKEARQLPLRITVMLASAAKEYKAARSEFLIRQSSGLYDMTRELGRLAELWNQAADWFEIQVQQCDFSDHTDQLYIDQVLKARAHRHRAHADSLLSSIENDLPLTQELIANNYQLLASLFDCEVVSFERKRYVNLSHTQNKAMNLNSYIGLVGRHFRERVAQEGCFLDETSVADAELSFPDCAYFITLDADSILLPDYALRLVHIMEQPGNERIAVAQTPYSAIPGSVSEVERVAGATTDIQYIIHQGFTHHDATYWVGANALLRHAALKEIAVAINERGYPQQCFIQDRTVIEDTESSVDLAARGWTLHNYPERLAYSATPPDFGSLLIQRRRWANGGLIILPKLLGYLLKMPGQKVAEAFLRIHYLVSIAAVNLGLLILLAFPFADSMNSLWLPLTAVPYFFLYGRDLLLCGYKPSDLLRVYALNLLLIPVNIGGVMKSIHQALSGRKIPFGRTPKIKGRTAAASGYILAAYLLFLQWMSSAAFDINEGHTVHALFAALNAVLLLYAIGVFIGLRESWQDLIAGFTKNPEKGHGSFREPLNKLDSLQRDLQPPYASRSRQWP